MRRVLTLSLIAGFAVAGPKGATVDMMNPRAPDTPLKVVFEPYTVVRHIAKGNTIEGDPSKIIIMRMPVDKLAAQLDLAKGWIAIQSPNFKILSTLTKAKVKFKDVPFARADLERLKVIFPKLTIGREGALLSPLERAHLYHIRCERLYSHFATLTDCKKRFLGMESHYEVYLFDDFAEHFALTDKFMGRGQKMPGIQHHVKEKPNFNMFVTSEQQVASTPGKGKGDRAFSNWVLHNVAHNLVDGHFNYYRETFAWIEEGVAHYYERLECERHNTFCWSEGKPPGDFKKPNWKSTIYNLVRRGKDPPLSGWCEKKQPGEMTGTENGISWSIVKWLIETEPVRFTKMLRKVDDFENKPTSAECIQHAFGCSPGVLHQRWRDYVKANYNKK